MEEISLKEIIEILIKGRKWILLTVLVFVVVALAFWLLQPKVYVSEAVLRVSPIDINPTAGSDGESLIGDITVVAQFPVMDINSYAKQIVNDAVLEHTVSALDLKDKEGVSVSMERIKSKITIRADEKTGIIYVTVRDSSPQTAANLSNMLGEQMRIYLAETIRQSCAETMENISRQMEIQKDQIGAVTELLKIYGEGPKNVQLLEIEIENLITQISQYKADLNDMERNLQTDALALETMRSMVNAVTGESPVASASASLFKVNIPDSGTRTRNYSAKDAEASALFNNGTPIEVIVEGGSDIESLVLSVKKMELQTRLVQSKAEYESLLARLDVMEEDLSQMTGVFTEEKQKYDILQRDYKLAGEIYAKYQKIYQQVAVIASSELAWKNIQILSHASMAVRPENKGALFYAAIGGILGLFTGGFGVLFKNYWVRESEVA